MNILFLQHLWFQYAGAIPQLGQTAVVYCPQRNNSDLHQLRTRQNLAGLFKRRKAVKF